MPARGRKGVGRQKGAVSMLPYAFARVASYGYGATGASLTASRGACTHEYATWGCILNTGCQLPRASPRAPASTHVVGCRRPACQSWRAQKAQSFQPTHKGAQSCWTVSPRIRVHGAARQLLRIRVHRAARQLLLDSLLSSSFGNLSSSIVHPYAH